MFVANNAYYFLNFTSPFCFYDKSWWTVLLQKKKLKTIIHFP